MNTITFLFIFLLGTIIGSFLNVVIYRFNTGKSITTGRSICMTCNDTLRWYELIPVFSFLIQSGKCRRCSERIGHQYPLVELGTGLMFTLVAYHFLPILIFSLGSYIFLVTFFVFIFSILMVIGVYDIRHKVIPDTLVYVFSLASFASIFINTNGIGYIFISPSLSYLLAGPILAAPFAILWLVSRGRWMGLGDAKLMLGIGFLLGPVYGLSAMVLSFWIGCIVILAIMFSSRKKITMKTEIPFAPFLIISTLIVFLFKINVFNLNSLF